MIERAGRFWRIAATALSFTLFGIGGLLLRVLVFPVLALLVRSRERRARTARGVFLMAFVKRADCIVKSQLWHNPFTGGPIRAAAYISSAHGPELVNACIASLRAGNNLIIFPEGTRTPAAGPVALQRGAAHIAVRG